MSTLKIEANSIFRVKIEELGEFYKSAFREQYITAANSLNKILNYENVEGKEVKEDEYNNIIAFVGERGSGKTSSMVSFKNSLKPLNICKINNFKNYIKDYEEHNKFDDLKKIYNKLSEGRKFYTLDTIDPSMFNNKDSIVEIVVAEMFKNFRETDYDREYTSKYELVKIFELVYKDLRILNKDKESLFEENIDNLEILTDLSSAVSLKNSMRKLVECYLKYMNNNGNKDCLIISIDDLDMNITAGEKMLEDIRKYLIIPQVAILLSIKLEQVEELVKQRNIIQLKELGEFYRNMDNINNREYKHGFSKKFDFQLNNKTQKYLDKLIPYTRRIYMPDIINKDSIKVEINIDKEDIVKFNKTKVYKEETLKEAVARLLKEKLNYFITTKEHFTSIVPNNLRGLIDFIVFLEMMPAQSEEDIKKNIISMNTYYKNIVVDSFQNNKMKELLNEILICDINYLNKTILIYLNEELYKDLIKIEQYRIISQQRKYNLDLYNHIKEIFENRSVILKENISLGDIVTWIKLYESMSETKEEKRFIESVKSIYSLRLLYIYHEKPQKLLSITSYDFLGHYLYATENKYKNKFEEKIMLSGKLEFNFPKYSELFESIKEDVIKNDNGSYKFEKLPQLTMNKKLLTLEEKQLKEIINQIKAFYNLLEMTYEPKAISFIGLGLERYYRRKGINESTYIGKSEFEKFYLKPLNMIGMYIYGDQINDFKDSNSGVYIDNELKENIDGIDISSDKKKVNKSILFIINIDYYMKLLHYFDHKLENNRYKSSEDYNELLNHTERTINNIHKELIEKYSIYEFDYSDKLIELCDECKNFIDNNLRLYTKKNKTEGIKSGDKKSLLMTLQRIYNYIGSTSSAVLRGKRILNKGSYEKIVKKMHDDLLDVTSKLKNTSIEESVQGKCSSYIRILSEVNNYNDTKKVTDNIIKGRETINDIKKLIEELNIVEE